jgi:hypothetical protein
VFHVVRPCRNDKEIHMMLSKEATLFNSDTETDMILSKEVIISCNK